VATFQVRKLLRELLLRELPKEQKTDFHREGCAFAIVSLCFEVFSGDHMSIAATHQGMRNQELSTKLLIRSREQSVLGKRRVGLARRTQFWQAGTASSLRGMMPRESRVEWLLFEISRFRFDLFLR